MRTWIFGDSFSASTDASSWVNSVESPVIKSSNGSSEYRIWRTYKENKHKISASDRVVFCHTSPSRVFLKDDAELQSRKLSTHPNCDLLINDADEEYATLLSAIWSTSYTEDIFNLIVSDLKKVPNSTHITFFESETIHSLHNVWMNFSGDINHMSALGNKIAFDSIAKLLNPIKRLVVFGASLAQGYGLDNPDTESFGGIIASHLNVPFNNQSVGGSSIMESLYVILNFKFEDGDCVILMWGPQERDYIFDKMNNISMGSWQEKSHPELFKSWVETHSLHDLSVRGWLNIHHALMFLQSKGVRVFNFADYYRPYRESKPSFIDIELLDSRAEFYKEFTKNANDGNHLGVRGHQLVAKRILKIMGYL